MPIVQAYSHIAYCHIVYCHIAYCHIAYSSSPHNPPVLVIMFISLLYFLLVIYLSMSTPEIMHGRMSNEVK